MEDNKPESITSTNGISFSVKELREKFKIVSQGEKDCFCGKCSYCGIEVVFSDPTKAKIIVKDSEKEDRSFLIYHDGCHERYLRRTID